MIRKIGICQCLVSRGTLMTTKYNVNILRHITVNHIYYRRHRWQHGEIFYQKDLNGDVPEVIQYAADENIIYSSYLHTRRIGFTSHHERRKREEKMKMFDIKKMKAEAIPLILEKLLSKENVPHEYENKSVNEEKGPKFDLPYSAVDDISVNNLEVHSNSGKKEFDWDEKFSVRDDIENRMQAYEQSIGAIETSDGDLAKEALIKGFSAESVLEYASDSDGGDDDDPMYSGTCDPNIPVSKVPCGGCGSQLHCQQYSLPGFVPKELFERCDAGELRSIECQRCYFLKHHNVALNVRVSPDLYLKLLEPIKNEKALVIVVVDLLDVPCSIWPNLIDIIGTRRPVIIVGNKVDLLPSDGDNYLKRISDSLTASVDRTALGRANIKLTALVSAHTGFGIESLINKIHTNWGTKGDIYIIGCTNTGKSTLFNALLGSDMCKTAASELIYRATTSPWPGTTLNMLKFPILRASGYKLLLRTQRLQQIQMENQKNSNKIPNKYAQNIAEATLSGQIQRTFDFVPPHDDDGSSNPFSIKTDTIPKDKMKILGINENHPRYASGKWCYDTPGTVQPDQIINLLTHEELMKVLPQELILPRTFTFTNGKTIFIGGLARLDLLYCPESVRFTVFAAADIPVSIVRTVDASAFYRKYLGTSLLGVPSGDEERLQHWPTLTPCDLKTRSISKKESCADVVLSSAGWIALTSDGNHIIEIRGWTPGGRGIYLRSPSMLPYSVSLRGARLEKTPAYRPHSLLIPNYGTSVFKSLNS